MSTLVARAAAPLLVAMVLVLAACDARSATPPPSKMAASPTSAPQRTLELVEGPFGDLAGNGEVMATALLHASLFRFDDRLEPRASLAEWPCASADDGRTLTCTLRPSTFSDGSPVTATDVVFSYSLGLYQPCVLGCSPHLESVSALDERTVVFHLKRPSASFISSVMTRATIVPEHAVQASFDRFIAKARSVDIAEVEAQMVVIDEAVAAARPDCDAVLPAAEAVLIRGGATVHPRTDARTTAGAFDPCLHSGELWNALDNMAGAIRKTDRLDAIASAFEILDIQENPVGAGPWKLERFTRGEELVAVGRDGYVDGPPGIQRVRIRSVPDMARATDLMVGGDIDWLNLQVFASYDLGEHYPRLRDASSVRLLRYPSFGFLALMYNLREGQLFADGRLRHALELCVDKSAAVDAATKGEGLPIDSWVIPNTWAYLAPAGRPERQPEAARELIEAAGWVVGPDGVYARDGRRLAFDVPVRSDTDDRIKFVDLLSFQLRDCGVELRTRPIAPDVLLPMPFAYPHLVPGTEERFEAYLGGWGIPFDPASVEFFMSNQISSETPPDDPNYVGYNFIGYDNPRVDELVSQADSTFDLKQRARIIRELQEVVVADRPYLFAWAPLQYDAISRRLTTIDGPINPDSLLWWWAPERWTFDPAS